MVDTKRSKRPVICLIVCHREFCEKESWVWKILACLFAKDYAHLGAIFFFGWNTSKYKQSGCSAFLSLPLFFILINNFFFFTWKGVYSLYNWFYVCLFVNFLSVGLCACYFSLEYILNIYFDFWSGDVLLIVTVSWEFFLLMQQRYKKLVGSWLVK
jgi:hypothetical protein